MKTVSLKLSHCPVCEVEFYTAINPFENANLIEAGDIGVCFKCASFLIFEDDFSLRLLSQDEIGSLPSDMRSQLIKSRKLIFERNGTLNND
jgi:hypothetical protein